MKPVCTGCGKGLDELPEYAEVAAGSPEDEKLLAENPHQFMIENEGTYNPENGHFLCTDCYIAAGQPSSEKGWIAE